MSCNDAEAALFHRQFPRWERSGAGGDLAASDIDRAQQHIPDLRQASAGHVSPSCSRHGQSARSAGSGPPPL